MKYFYLFIALLLINFDSFSQWSPNPYANTAVCNASFKQKEIRIESDSDGGAFIVWRDYRTGQSISDIYIQKVDADGYNLWTVDGLGLCILPSNQGTPSVVSDGKGGVIVVWTDRRTGSEDVYAQRIDVNGNILWAPNGVQVCGKSNREHSGKIVSDDESGVIVVWEDERIDTTFNIFAQRIDSTGNALWAAGGISLCAESSNRINHKVQKDRNGGAIIVWQDQRSGEFDIWGQNVDANSSLLWGNNGKAMCISSGVQTNPKIDPEKASGGIFVSWVDKRNGVDYDIYCNKIDSAGDVQWGFSGKPVVTAVGNQSALDILSNNKTNGVIVTWKDKRNTEYDIYVQKLDLDGNPEWQTDGILVCGVLGDQLNPNIISDKNGGAIIVWQDERSFDWDIYAQRVSYNGNMIWETNGIPVSLAVDNQTSPKNIPDNKGGTIIAWEDKRDGFSKDIYMTHILFPDTVTYPGDTISDTVSSINTIDLATLEVSPNPFQDVFEIRLKNIETYEVQLIDVLGRKIENVLYESENDFLKVDTKDSQLTNGMFYLVINNETSFRTIKLLKKD